MQIHPVILCGGGGARLWPLSRKALPKPFLPLVSEESLFQQAIRRVAGDDRFAAPMVVAAEAHGDLHLERGLAVARGEPYGTAHRRTIADGPVLVDGPHFRLERIEGVPDAATSAACAGALLALPLAGDVAAADGSACAGAGECLVAESLGALDFSAANVTLLVRAC